MPREQITIESFDAGIITTVDAQDTPINEASWSLDQDPEAPLGVLRGREGDDAYIDANNNHSASTFAWIVREDGKRDFIFYSKTTGNFCSVVDFYGAKTYALQAGLTTEMQTSIESVNRSVRLSSGNNAVKYLGYIDHGQFGAAAPSGLQYVDAKLSVPTIMPRYHKVAYISGTYGYGIEYEGQYIYKVTMATGVFSIGTTRFQKIKSICHNGTNLYVFDEGASTYGTLYLIDLTTLGITASYPLKGWGSDGTALSGCSVCDIELSKGNTNIYFAVRRADGTVKYDGSTAEQGNCWIWKYATASLVNNTTFSTAIYSFLLTPTVTPTRGVFHSGIAGVVYSLLYLNVHL
jgi:hypothetical protein